ncbi:MAG: DNA mismatch repair endonuclease MutL [Pseudomonadota bacterium]
MTAYAQNLNPETDPDETPKGIVRLDETMVNQIAAGEVIERPSSVVKELVENAIDAGATRIDIVTSNGGKTLMRVTDNGHGMDPDNLVMAIERHCTSKLNGDLMNITNLGFRGEALPSVGSVSRLKITSRSKSEDTAWKISVTGGKVDGPVPAALSEGTVVEVSDLFFATPARLKFLKSDQAENNAITDVFKRTALAFPHIRFSLSGEDRSALDYPATSQFDRLTQVLGNQFTDNTVEIDAIREGVSLRGFASVPTYHRGNSLNQYFYVNGRPVKDKNLFGAVRGAYMDFLPKGKHPVLALFIDLDPVLVDVNVHPAKADVRFRDPGLVRGLIVGALRQAISEEGPLSSHQGSQEMMQAFRSQPSPSFPSGFQNSFDQPRNRYSAEAKAATDWARPLGETTSETTTPYIGLAEEQAEFVVPDAPSGYVAPENVQEPGPSEQFPLGAARAQLHKNYIVSQTETGLIIVDQHAAHERIVYEALKAGLEKGVASQLLLVPEIIDMPEEYVNQLVSFADDFEKLGLEIEAFGPGAIAVRATPALLGEVDAKKLLTDLADEISEWDSAEGLQEKLHHVAATVACHGSVRSGRILKPEEMNSLLRQMETTPNSGQCNHGRPTYIELDLKDIERLFGR